MTLLTVRALLTVSQAAYVLGVHPNTLRRWADGGKIPVTRLPSGHRRWTREQIVEVNRKLKGEPTAEAV